MTYDEGSALAKSNNMDFIETSAKQDTNVKEAFNEITKLIIIKSGP